MPEIAEFEQTVYMRYSRDCDDAYIGRTKHYERRQSEHWRLSALLPHITILEKVTASTEGS
jgi:hypothetical protein